MQKLNMSDISQIFHTVWTSVELLQLTLQMSQQFAAKNSSSPFLPVSMYFPYVNRLRDLKPRDLLANSLLLVNLITT
jgi:hypothetical protein